MAVNKVVYNTESGAKTLIDLTNDSVTPETLAEGATAHDASGEQITGTMPTNDDYLASICNKTVKEIVNDKVTTIYSRFQQGNKNLIKVDLPLITKLFDYSFQDCGNLKIVNLPSVTTIDSACFERCGIEELYLPSLVETTGWGYIFNASALKRVVFPIFTGTIKATTFNGCGHLQTLVLGADTVCSLENTNAFNGTPIAKKGVDNLIGYIYVKRALVDSYKSATNWSAFATQFRAIEDYPEVLEGLE